jgi:6-phosphogluconate dehydrogenase
MQLGVIGLGRMGANIVRRLTRAGHACVVYDRDPAPGKALEAEGATAVDSLTALIEALAAPRTVWIMLPAGAATETTIELLRPLLKRGDCVIDGGNSYWRDDVRRGKSLAADGIDYMDVGVSGGVWGLTRGFCMMIGGKQETAERLDPIFQTLAPGRGEIAQTTRASSRAISTPDPAAPAISSRWCTTASNTV